MYSDTIFNSAAERRARHHLRARHRLSAAGLPGDSCRANYYEQVPLGQLPPRNVQVFDPQPADARATSSCRSATSGRSRTGLALSVDYVNNRGEHLIRRIDTNAPVVGACRRPALGGRRRCDPPDRAGGRQASA